MRYIIDHDLHIHSGLSSCSNDENQNATTILNYAKQNGLKTVCVTDHYFDSDVEGASTWYLKQNYEHISKILPLPTSNGINFLFGCETELNKELVLGIPQKRLDNFKFIIIPTTHFHMVGYTIPEYAKDSVEEKVKLWISHLDAVLNMNLPFEKVGIAHIACDLLFYNDKPRYKQLLDTIPQAEMERLFTKCAKLGVGIEINRADFKYSEVEKDSVLRIFKTAKNCGCKFYLGSDAHHPSDFNETIYYFNKAIDDIGLTENDKFDFNKLNK